MVKNDTVMNTDANHPWQYMYPPLQSHAQGWLEVGDGHQVFWEECGNPLGQPALFVHGGPGAGCSADNRRWFDPRRYRIVLFDQRGAGRSRPSGRLIANDTGHLLRDMEMLRQHLQIERWLLFGGSWGATLALAYAQQHPDRVHALVLRGIFTATAHESRWLYTPQGAAKYHPTAWQRLTQALATSPHTDLLQAFALLLHCGDAAVEQSAAHAWLQWEQDLMAHELTSHPAPRSQAARDAGASLAMARIGVHFAWNAFFLNEAQLLLEAHRLQTVAGIMVHGERDLITPPAAALALHRVWPGAQLHVLEAAGHASSQAVMARQLIAATDFFSKNIERYTAPWSNVSPRDKGPQPTGGEDQ